MECPVCKSAFSKVEEILHMVNRSFYCIHCWSRLVSYPDGEEGCRVEEDWMGEKWRLIEKQLANRLQETGRSRVEMKRQRKGSNRPVRSNYSERPK
jgi:hypothetical protein